MAPAKPKANSKPACASFYFEEEICLSFFKRGSVICSGSAEVTGFCRICNSHFSVAAGGWHGEG